MIYYIHNILYVIYTHHDSLSISVYSPENEGATSPGEKQTRTLQVRTLQVHTMWCVSGLMLGHIRHITVLDVYTLFTMHTKFMQPPTHITMHTKFMQPPTHIYLFLTSRNMKKMSIFPWMLLLSNAFTRPMYAFRSYLNLGILDRFCHHLNAPCLDRS